jgi:class 3 adenylate cyclase
MALFRSASQAVRAALEVQDLFGMEMDANSALPLSAGIGLAAGSYAHVADTQIGLTPKLAECLCALAGPGEILVSESIRIVVGEAPAVSLVERGQVQLRGFQDPITVFQVLPPPREMDKA